VYLHPNLGYLERKKSLTEKDRCTGAHGLGGVEMPIGAISRNTAEQSTRQYSTAVELDGAHIGVGRVPPGLDDLDLVLDFAEQVAYPHRTAARTRWALTTGNRGRWASPAI
jgi:hypothetical protein